MGINEREFPEEVQKFIEDYWASIPSEDSLSEHEWGMMEAEGVEREGLVARIIYYNGAPSLHRRENAKEIERMSEIINRSTAAKTY